VGEDKVTRRAHLEASAAKGNAKSAETLIGPDMPEALDYLWSWFQRLHLARRAGMAGLERLAFLDIDAANRLLEWQILPHEVDALFRLDLVTLYPGTPTA
jgi:hypothetical protein